MLNAWLVSRAAFAAHRLRRGGARANSFFNAEIFYDLCVFFVNGRVRRIKPPRSKGTLRCQLLPKGVRGTGGPPRGARRVKNVNLSFARKGGREIYVFDTLSWKRNTAYQLQASVQGSQSCRGVRGREVPATENVAFKVGRRRIAGNLLSSQRTSARSRT